MKALNLGVGKWQMRMIGDEEWLETSLPGEVHLALMEAGRIPDPFVADNEIDVAWVAESDWEFKGIIKVPEDLLEEDQAFLRFDGLDTLAQVSINGAPLGASDNAFRVYSWDVKPYLVAGENEISIRFGSPVNHVKPFQHSRPLPAPGESIPGGPFLRKAPCQWGWDWGPKLPPIGIWKGAFLEGFTTAKLDSVHLRQSHEFNGSVNVSAEATVQKWDEAHLQLCLTLRDPNGKTFATTCKFLDGSATASIEISNPLLWQPNGYGDQHLYQAQISLRMEDDKVLDERDFQLGLRTLELRQAPDEFGESFTFVVNGTPIFCKGSNWIPADSFPTRITRDQLAQLLGDAALANHNMIRVWGGGFYESEDFYDLCDQLGILVWQDFIFSCSIYPLDDPEFLANLQAEVRDNVSRIRHRASLALWCGNNEMDWGWESWGWNKKENQALQDAYRKFFYETLPGWVELLDPDTPYWFSSPSSGTPFEEANSNDQGDAHYWEVWHGAKPFSAYRAQFPRFMSEFGFQSLPPLKTIAAYASEDHWNLTDYMIEHHQRSHYASALFMGQMALHYMMPVDFPSLVYLTMVLQAEGIRSGVEHWRRHNHRVSGTLYWQLNDCWPVASWSSLDYFGRWKALHYASRKFYSPVLLSIEDDQPAAAMRVHLTNDSREGWEGKLAWQLIRLDGEVLESGELDAAIGPHTSELQFEREFGSLSLEEKRETVFIAQLYQDGDLISTQLATFVPNKHLQLVDPKLKVYLNEGEAKTLTIELEAEYLARFVELSLDNADVVFSDNYFDVIPGQIKRITCPLPEGWMADDLGRSLTVFTLYDSFGE
jgi:beta-mannosidase